ncbi:Two component transcriptional regulator, LuxR family [Crenothrix polyspora]|uniref:Two component transcriptional regulator, LuxR family n=1 Tax=Crenothrix polyspora TaxID=360316 RepID=A0A1R4HBG3_9GAMM|nr:response regulator transcription factor [Crenothrix polyspora]SJM93210.1 Two component transcriptional regulator, LuxR family [Crenothrix polyspora]
MHILLVDDHALFREALVHVLNQLAPLMVVHEAANIEEATYRIANTRNLDLMLLDIDLQGVDGLSALPSLRKLAPTVSIVVLSGSETCQHIRQAQANGAVGYIPKTHSSHQMLAALRIILAGDVYFPCYLQANNKPNHTSTKSEPSILTIRQHEVLQLMAQGLPNKSIAKALEVTEGTVKLHIVAILQVLGAHNRTEAVIKAMELLLVDIPSH